MRKRMRTFDRYYNDLELKWDKIFARLDEIIRLIENRHKRAKFLLQKGFTLIELLVVVAIIGILSTIAMASFNSAQMKARDSQRRSDLSQIRSALELARSDSAYSLYPNAADTVSPVTCFATTDGTAGTCATSLMSFLGPAPGKGYMKVVPDDPRYGHYIYVSADGYDYTLVGCLENVNDPKQDKDANDANSKNAGCSLPGQLASVTFVAP